MLNYGDVSVQLNSMKSKTLYDKIWDDHLVKELPDGNSLIYIDRHLIHEVTSPQAFEGLNLAGRELWRKDSIKAVSDHNVPTTSSLTVNDQTAKIQLETLNKNCKEHNILHLKMGDRKQGIVHVTGPELGWCLPGTTVVCGDSHTATNGALAAMAWGIGTSEIEHVMATQCLIMKKSKNMEIIVTGKLAFGVTAKDVILYIIGKIGTAGATGHAIEYKGDVIKGLTMEERMTICNMSIEAGGRIGLVAFDDVTEEYLKDKPFAPSGAQWSKAVKDWRQLYSDEDALFDKKISISAKDIAPQVSWGTSPEMVVGVDECIPDPAHFESEVKRIGMQNALDYMSLSPGQKISDITIDKVFIGSCTNSRIEDLRAASEIIKGRKKAKSVKLAMVVPGSGLVKEQAESEGIDQIFRDAGFEWRNPGCSMCLGMNEDQLSAGERCASTSNRNFEGRQGQGGRTHLVSPVMAATAAIEGRFKDYRDF